MREGMPPPGRRSPHGVAASAHPPAGASPPPRFADVEAAAQGGGEQQESRPPFPCFQRHLSLRPLCSMALPKDAFFKWGFKAPLGESPRDLSLTPEFEASLVPRHVGGWSTNLRTVKAGVSL